MLGIADCFGKCNGKGGGKQMLVVVENRLEKTRKQRPTVCRLVNGRSRCSKTRGLLALEWPYSPVSYTCQGSEPCLPLCSLWLPGVYFENHSPLHLAFKPHHCRAPAPHPPHRNPKLPLRHTPSYYTTAANHECFTRCDPRLDYGRYSNSLNKTTVGKRRYRSCRTSPA